MSIDRVGTVCIFVGDQDRAKAFYTQTLGFELRTDVQPWGTFATIEDSEGNHLLLVEQPNR
jgi:catechol 2,3-dioxygenase-like lactoylglutathione lyase family enzyme